MDSATLQQDNQSRSVPASPGGPTVVGIGASAGGLTALKRFFELIPADSALAFVVVVHLSPEHKSHLADLLQPSVRFPVQQVTENVVLEANHVYVIPPNANLESIDTHLRLSKLEEQRRERAPIDHFFRTLAATHDGHSIGIILTGTGSDGTLGLKEIKAKGGVVLVQDPNDAEFDGMPQSAIATGLVDRVLPIAEIPGALLRLAEVGPHVFLLGNEDEPAPTDRILLPKVVSILKARTGRDFSRYKAATLLRRIARRMQLSYLEDFQSYITKLREQPEEVQALADDLLITVTSFFRDPEVFTRLEKDVIPQLFNGKGPEDTLRIWSVGCATGEEAYSLAILFLEEAGRRESPPKIQIFASDLHKRSLLGAREGLYPGDIQADVAPERLRRFFQKENGGYRIAKSVRETVVFAPHNLLGDPPFSRLDLITCRNLLIYLNRWVQRDVIDLFHYSLCSNGFLLLGSAETIDASELFRTEDKKLCLYRKRNVPPPEQRLPVFPTIRFGSSGEPGTKVVNAPEPIPYQALHETFLERYAPPSILVGPENKLVHLSEHAGRYLIHPSGELTSSVVKLVRDELRIELQSLLQSTRDTKVMLDSRPIPVQFDKETAPVVMHLRPALDLDQEGFVLVIFEEHQPDSPTVSDKDTPNTTVEERQKAKRIAELEKELLTARQRLQTVIEEYETSREEMKTSHEEMQSTNEELRSTMEELETSKEELQSINEELQTVNQENRHKVEELSQLSSDLQNLLAATDIATLFLDRDLRILRFTPKLARLFNVRITDRGRPISDLTHRLGYEKLREDAQTVLDNLIPIERETQDDESLWYLTRVLPYRSTEDRIEGVVITFFEITARKLAEAALMESQERQAFLLRLSDELRPLTDPDALQAKAARLLGSRLSADRVYYAEVDRHGRVTVANNYHANGTIPAIGNYRFDALGAPAMQTLLTGRTIVHGDVESLETLSPAERSAHRQFGIASQVKVPLVKNDHLLAYLAVQNGTRRSWTKEEVSLIEAVAERTWASVERARAEKTLMLSEERLRMTLDASQMGTFLYHVAEDQGEPDRRMLALFGLPETGTLSMGKALETMVHPDDRAAYAEAMARATDPSGSGVLQTELRLLHPDRTEHWVAVIAQTVFEGAPRRPTHMWGMAYEITERKRADEAIRRSAADFADLARKFEATLSTIKDSVFTFDIGGRILYASRHLTDLWGLQPGEEAGKELADVNYPPELRKRLLDYVRRVFESGETIHDEASYTLPTGATGHYDYILSPAFRADGKIDYVVVSARDITERKQIEEAVSRSEEKYRTLFTSMDEAFCTIEVLFNERGKAVDYIFLETNPAFVRQTGLSNAVGKRMRQIAPQHEDFWFETYGHIAKNGPALRFEHEDASFGRYHDLYAFRIGSPGENRVAILFNDITGRKREEEQQAYLLKLNDALRTVTDPLEIQDVAMRILGEQLHVSRAAFYETFESGDEAQLGRGFSASGTASSPERLRLSDYGEFFRTSCQGGTTIVLTNTEEDARLNETNRAAFQAVKTRAAVCIPLVKAGRLTAVLSVSHPDPHEWSASELSILDETARRTWVAVERARTEDALSRNESRFRALVTAGSHPMYRMSPDWRQMYQLDGHNFLADTTEPIDDWMNSYLLPEDHQAVRATFQKAIRDKSLFELEHRVRLVDGSIGWVLSRAIPILAPDGAITEWFGAGIDINGRKNAETAQRYAEEQIRLFVENVKEYALVQTDPDGAITNWNPGAQRLFGYNAEQMVGNNVAVLLTPEDAEAGLFTKELETLAKGNRNEDARWFVREDGSRFWARWISEPIFDSVGRFRGVAKVMRDETERARAETLIRNSLAEKEELLNEVHHRVKNNLQVIVSLLNMQAAQIEDQRVSGPFQETRNRILAISSIHEMLYRAESFASIAVVDYARQLASRLLRFYGLESRVLLEIVGNGTALELERAVPYGILLNELVSNACKHAFPSPQDGILTIKIQPEGHFVELVVADTGPGLPDDFNYMTASSLGLRLVHGLVRQLRGTIEISSKPGTAIKVRFPAAEAGSPL